MEIIESSAHRVFSADGTDSENLLHIISTENGGNRFSPAVFFRQLFKIFL